MFLTLDSDKKTCKSTVFSGWSLVFKRVSLKISEQNSHHPSVSRSFDCQINEEGKEGLGNV